MSFAKEGKTMIYNYYPGCTLSTKAKQLDMAARRCAEVLGFPLTELPEWQCCGAVYPMAPDAIAERLSAVRALVAARENGDGGRLHRRTAPQAVRHRACTEPPDSRMTKRCPHSCTAAANRKMGSTPLSSAHQSAAMSTRKPSRT